MAGSNALNDVTTNRGFDLSPRARLSRRHAYGLFILLGLELHHFKLGLNGSAQPRILGEPEDESTSFLAAQLILQGLMAWTVSTEGPWKKMTFVLMGLCGTFLIVCCTAVLTEAGTKVKLMKAEPMPACTELSSIRATGYADDDTKTNLKNKAAEGGANSVRLETAGPIRSVFEITGTSCKCPE